MKFNCIVGIFALAVGYAGCDDAGSPGTDGDTGTGGQSADDGAADGNVEPGALAAEDVCGFDGPTELPEPNAEGFRDVPAQHPYLWYAGRIDCGAAAGPTLAFPGSTIRVHFSGTALSLRLTDSGGGTETSTNFYDVSVDGATASALEVASGDGVYELAAGLAPGEHEIVLGKRNEASPGGSPNAGRGVVLGFSVQGELLEAKGPARRLEFVGDSITCGYGIELSTTDPDNAHFTSKNENGRKSYGALTALALGAEYSGVAYSGKGMSRNYADGAGETVPDFYLDTVPDDPASSPWDPRRYVPQAVVINVGTNDFSTPGVNRDLYVERYTAFLASLRGYYPDAALVCAIGPMLSDYYPVGENAWTNAQADVQAAVDARHAAGDDNVHFLAFAPQSSPYGEDWHPSAATQQTMADETAALLRDVLGWQ